MTATEIGAALLKKPTSAECHKLLQACEPRRVEVRARLSVITPSGNRHAIPDPPAYQEAVLRGPAAVLELNRERELLRIELDQLDRLEGMCNQAAQEARVAELRAEIPKAVKFVRANIEHLRLTLSEYEAEVAALQNALNVIGEFENAGIAYPFDDDELAQILDLRERQWLAPPAINPPHNIPPMFDAPDAVAGQPKVALVDPRADVVARYPRSHALLYEHSHGPNGGAISTRRPPWAQAAIDRANRPSMPLAGKSNGTRREGFPSVL